MAVLSNTTVISTEIEKVDKKLPTFFEREGPFYAKIAKKKGIPVSNKSMRIPAEIRPHGSFGQYDPDGGSLGRGGGPLWKDMTIAVKHFRKVIEWTHLADIGTDSSEKAVVQVVQKALATAFDDYRKGLDNSAMTDGRGILGTITSVDTTGSVDTYTMNTDGFGAKLMVPGQKVGVVLFSTPNYTCRVGGTSAKIYNEIASIDYPNKLVKMGENITTATAGDWLVQENAIAGSGTTAPSSVYGVPYHHSDASTGTWLGMDRALYPEIRCNRVTASGALSLTHARLAINKIFDRVGQSATPKLEAWMHMCQRHAYENMAQDIMRIDKTASEEGVNLYFGNNLQLAGCPVNIHPSWDKTRIDFVDLNNWGRVEMEPVKFFEQEGRRLFEVHDTTDGGLTTYTQSIVIGSMNFFTYNPATCAYISGLTVMSGY